VHSFVHASGERAQGGGRVVLRPGSKLFAPSTEDDAAANNVSNTASEPAVPSVNVAASESILDAHKHLQQQKTTDKQSGQ
jgi:hypothetical protein